MEKIANTSTANRAAKLSLAAGLGAMALSTATPAAARDHDGIGAGEVIAGALIVGGLAAVAASATKKSNDGYSRGYGYGYDDRYGRYDDRYGRYDDRYGRGYDNGRGDSRQAVQACVAAAQRAASRYSYRGQANVTDIRDIDRKRDGYKIEGRIAVNAMDHSWRNGDARYGRGWNNDYRGWREDMRGYDSGSFDCTVRYGRVVDLDFHGIRGL